MCSRKEREEDKERKREMKLLQGADNIDTGGTELNYNLRDRGLILKG